MAKPDLSAAFGEWVQATRLKQGLTLVDLADAAGTGKSVVWGIEQGAVRPRLDSADKIAGALGVPLSKALQLAEKRHGSTTSTKRASR